ncbi:MAG: FAD-dependent oxidoreductase [Deltaproteobacteria bacterium]|nr:FAD-dependent oxidoreductase [Deltaproteobacteria bacterium]
MDNITLYSTDGCPFCIKAKSFLKEKHIGFSEIMVRPGSKELEEMKEKTGSDLPPQILIDGEPAGGYDKLVNLFTTRELSEKPGSPDELSSSLIYDVLIIGGGPAGLNAALYASRKVLKTILISYNIGGQVADTYDIENYLGFSQIETADLIRKFDEHVEKYGIEKLLGTKITSLDLTGKIKKITTGEGNTYYSRTVIIATGKRPRPLNVLGEKELIGRGVAYCSTCDAPLFAGADVAVIGGGNSALEAVIDLAKVANKIFMVSLTPLTGDPILINKVSSLSKVSIFTKHDTTRVIGDSNVKEIEIKSLDTGEVSRLKVEGVFIEIGLLPNSDIVIDTLETNRQGEIIIDNVCRTGITGVFACGDVTSIPYKQVIIAAGEGAKAALSAYDYLNKQR